MAYAGARRAMRAGLEAAADRFARAMVAIAGVRTRRTAEEVNVKWDGDAILIRAGWPGGAWGWDPIQALMFDDNRRHPLFGDRHHWYKQGRWPITRYTERAAIDEAAEAFADVFVPLFLREYGFK